jgi:hypothetical protein
MKNNQYFDLNETYNNILFESASSALIQTSERSASSNYFSHLRPDHIIITDTFNHFLFPIPYPEIDKNRLDLFDIYQYFQTKYAQRKLKYLPWHYTIELVQNKYVVYNTRPIDKIFPINNDTITDDIKTKIDNINIDINTIRNSIHIAIIGNTKKDVYTRNFYETLVELCIAPTLRLYKLNKSLSNSVTLINIGDRFKFNLLQHYVSP